MSDMRKHPGKDVSICHVQNSVACGFVAVRATNFWGNRAAVAGGAFFSYGSEPHANFGCVPQPVVTIAGAATASTVGSGPESKLL
jgi:hypothetical protein